ncbi:threonine dehydratase, partial [Streptococcus suis]
MITAKNVEQAYSVLKRVVVRTPLYYSRYLSEKYGATIYLKRENE